MTPFERRLLAALAVSFLVLGSCALALNLRRSPELAVVRPEISDAR